MPISTRAVNNSFILSDSGATTLGSTKPRLAVTTTRTHSSSSSMLSTSMQNLAANTLLCVIALSSLKNHICYLPHRCDSPLHRGNNFQRLFTKKDAGYSGILFWKYCWEPNYAQSLPHLPTIRCFCCATPPCRARNLA